MIQRYTVHYDVLDKVVRIAESREGPLVLYTAHLAEVTRLVRALRKARTGRGCRWHIHDSDVKALDALLAEYKERW